jgi:hypothetical protein
LELSRVPPATKYVLVHANFDNSFAAEAEHSLNLSREQAKELTKAGHTVIFGHEHQGRQAFGGKVIVVGNQFPSSVSDCLSHGDGQKDGKKYALIIDEEGPLQVETWCQEGNSVAVKWHELGEYTGPAKFIRVTGKANADQAADVVKAIAEMRKTSTAFVITNAVKVEQIDGTEEIAVSEEDLRSIDVIEMLLQSLTEEQAAVVRQLMEKN